MKFLINFLTFVFCGLICGQVVMASEVNSFDNKIKLAEQCFLESEEQDGQNYNFEVNEDLVHVNFKYRNLCLSKTIQLYSKSGLIYDSCQSSEAYEVSCN